ncbi:MAG: Na/Pi cotransporter family protein [Verrucomicrobiae bacterium]|nr:Na/Pi cotransporter family protein [Verrucomicrobiae bacterium]
MIPLLATTENLDWATLIMGVLGGLALFLFGMDQMTRALRVVAGAGMRQFLGKLTTNPVKGVMAGALTTAVIQSSSVTTVLVIGFVSAGLMTLSQAIGVIMGANVGTTITAQIVAFKITKYALILVAAGFAGRLIGGERKGGFYGTMVMGLGLLFFGMELMSDATKPLRDFQPFIDWMSQMNRPILGILVGAVVTAVVQSSSATTVMVIVLASQGYISLEAGIYLIFGANLGTCITAILGSLGKPREALQAALAHIFFNLAGVSIWFAFVPELADLVRSLSPAHPELEGAARLAAETPRQIANAHTVFNVANTVLLVGLTRPLAWLIQKLVPERPEDAVRVGEVKYLDDLYLAEVSTALDLTRKELSRLGAGVLRMLRGSLNKVLFGTSQDLEELRRQDNDIDALHGAVVTYLGKLSQQELQPGEVAQVRDYLATANHFEHIGDMVETELYEAGMKRLNQGVGISPATGDMLSELHRKVCWTVDSVVRALVDQDAEATAEVVAAKAEINRLADAAEERLMQRLTAAEPGRMAVFRIETDIVENLKRIYYFTKRIARVVTAEGSEETAESEAENPVT